MKWHALLEANVRCTSKAKWSETIRTEHVLTFAFLLGHIWSSRVFQRVLYIPHEIEIIKKFCDKPLLIVYLSNFLTDESSFKRAASSNITEHPTVRIEGFPDGS